METTGIDCSAGFEQAPTITPTDPKILDWSVMGSLNSDSPSLDLLGTTNLTPFALAAMEDEGPRLFTSPNNEHDLLCGKDDFTSIRSRTEAYLLRHFSRAIAPWVCPNFFHSFVLY